MYALQGVSDDFPQSLILDNCPTLQGILRGPEWGYWNLILSEYCVSKGKLPLIGHNALPSDPLPGF